MKDMSRSEKLILITVFLISLVLVFVGQRHVGYPGLAAEIVGLIGILTVLYLYNKKFK